LEITFGGIVPAIFISHSNLDATDADEIKQALGRLGYERVFLDFDKQTGIGAGENWERRLYDELSRCHAVILVLTPNWLGSTWCRIELSHARALGKVILPIICEPIGDRYVLPEVQSVDMLNWREGGLERVEQRLRAITSELARGFTLDPNRPPYPGIHSFEFEDAAIYFGRDEETRAVFERVEARRTQGGPRCLVIIGASGSGKSSLLKAGVLPQLARRRREWVLLPTIRPEKAPLEALAKALAEAHGNPDSWRNWVKSLVSAVAVDHIAELVKDLRTGEARNATVLLPIDQLEEILTVTPAVERAAFLDVLAVTLDPTRGLPFMVIASGRSDVLEGLAEVGTLAHVTETFPLPPLPFDRVTRLIEGPAAVAGFNIEKGLSEIIARDLETPDALPLLAHALWLLYRRCMESKKLTVSEYWALSDPARKLNPIQNSVRLTAEQVVAGARPSEEELIALRDAFVPHLVRVRLDDGKRVRQSARMSELPGRCLRLVRALVDARLLSTHAPIETTQVEPKGGDILIEVSHEALFEAWPSLDQWLSDEHSFLSDLERMKGAYEIWAAAATEQKAKALLGGLLLSRARDWLSRYPQRFVGGEMAALGDFITESTKVEDAERTRVQLLQRRLLRGAVAASIVLAVAAGFSGWQYLIAEKQKVTIVEQRDRLLIVESHGLADRAHAAVERGDAVTGMLLALSGLPDTAGHTERPHVSAAEAALFAASQARRESIVLSGHVGGVLDVAFSPDGRWIVTASDDDDKTTRIWDTANGALLAILSGHTARVNSAAFSPDGSRILTASSDRAVRLWDAKTGSAVATLAGHTDAVNSAIFSPDGTLIASAAGYEFSSQNDHVPRIWDAATGALVATLQGHTAVVNSIAFSPDGSRVVTASYDRTARIWDARTGALLVTLLGHGSVVNVASFSPDGRRIVTGSSDETARVWDADSGAELLKLREHVGQISRAAFSPDGTRIVTAASIIFGANDHTARLWDSSSGVLLARLSGHAEQVNSAQFSPDGGLIVTASPDKTVRLWGGRTGAFLATLAGHTDWVFRAKFAPDGRRIASISNDRTARIWDVTPSVPAVRLIRNNNSTWSAAFSPDGAKIVTAASDKKARVWDAESGALLMTLSHTAGLNKAGYSPDGRLIVAVTEDSTARVWSATTGAMLMSFDEKGAQLSDAHVNPASTRLVTASRSGARIWDLKTGQLLMILLENKNVRSVLFGPEGARVVTVSFDGTVQIWNAIDGNSVATLSGKSSMAAFSPDGAHVVTVSGSAAMLWDASSGSPLSTLSEHDGQVTTASFSPDGSKVVTALADSTARIWDAVSGTPLRTLSGHARISGGGMSRASLRVAVFSTNGERVLTASDDGTARLWDVRTGETVGVLPGHEGSIGEAAFSSDGSRVLTLANSTDVRIWRVFQVTQRLVDYAKRVVPRCLTRAQRAAAFLGPQPPEWCVEMEKWPYGTGHWKN
jgi:WD40 repeat protein